MYDLESIVDRLHKTGDVKRLQELGAALRDDITERESLIASGKSRDVNGYHIAKIRSDIVYINGALRRLDASPI